MVFRPESFLLRFLTLIRCNRVGCLLSGFPPVPATRDLSKLKVRSFLFQAFARIWRDYVYVDHVPRYRVFCLRSRWKFEEILTTYSSSSFISVRSSGGFLLDKSSLRQRFLFSLFWRYISMAVECASLAVHPEFCSACPNVSSAWVTGCVSIFFFSVFLWCSL